MRRPGSPRVPGQRGAARSGAERLRGAAGAISFLPTPPAALGRNCPAQKVLEKASFSKSRPQTPPNKPKGASPFFYPLSK